MSHQKSQTTGEFSSSNRKEELTPLQCAGISDFSPQGENCFFSDTVDLVNISENKSHYAEDSEMAIEVKSPKRKRQKTDADIVDNENSLFAAFGCLEVESQKAITNEEKEGNEEFKFTTSEQQAPIITTTNSDGGPVEVSD